MEKLNETLATVQAALSDNDTNSFTLSDGHKFDFARLTQVNDKDLPAGFEIGEFCSNDEVIIPAFLPFNTTNGIAFSIEEISSFSHFNELLERSVFRILSVMRYNSFKLTLIDGKNYGSHLNALQKLDESITGNKIYKDQAEIAKALHEINSNSTPEFRFIIINNFPNSFTNESASTLLKILHTAKNEKIKVLMTKELAPSRSIADLDSAISEKLELISFNKNNQWFSKTLSQVKKLQEYFVLNFGSAFSDSEIKETTELINVMHQSSINPASENFDINDGIKIRIGTTENNKSFYFRLGHGASNYHAIIAGRSGKGKTVLLDNIISGSLANYTPDELRFVLLDMKGIEFNEYKSLPHVQAFCSSSDIGNGMKIIEFLQGELKLRETLLNDAEASSIVEYKKKSGKAMARLLVIIDEFQNLFTGNYKMDNTVEEVLIKQILRLGRAYGVHLLCCTQSLGDGVRMSFLNNIPLRIAFQMMQDQSRNFLSINNPAAENLKIGQALYNEQDGILSENVVIKIDYLTTEDIHNRIVEFVEKGRLYELFEKLIIKK